MLTTTLLTAILPALATASPLSKRWAGDTLAGLAEKSNKYLGTAYQSFYLADERFEPILNSQFDQYTPENEMKWEIVQAERGVFNWTGADLVCLTITHHLTCLYEY
jgi:endo-1,4-beta-xylanase